MKNHKPVKAGGHPIIDSSFIDRDWHPGPAYNVEPCDNCGDCLDCCECHLEDVE